jgi:hypothetical protein
VNDNSLWKVASIYTWKGPVGKWSGPTGRRDRVGVVKVGKRPFYVPLVGVFWRESVLKQLGGCLLSFSMYKRGFHGLLKFRPSSLLMLCGCGSCSIASLISRSVYPDLAERSLVS